MSGTRLLTAQDAFEYAEGVVSGHGTSFDQTAYRWAIHNAYTELGSKVGWSFLNKQFRIFINAAKDDGTVTYDHTGGAYERLVTLSGTGATFPDWAEDATIRLDGLPCRIEEVKSSTTATLDANMNPGADVAAGSSYRIYRSYYALPNDFRRLVSLRAETVGWQLSERTYDEIMALDRDYNETGTPTYFCIRGVEDLYGQMGLFLHPDSDSDASLDGIYERIPREIRYFGFNQNVDYAGTISATAGSATITGSGTAFSTLMIGSILRISSSAVKPGGLQSANPFVEQHSIVGVGGPTSLTLDTEVSTNRSAVKYVIVDPIDIDASLHRAYLACVVKQLALDRGWKDSEMLVALYEDAVDQAKSANHSTERKWAGYRTQTLRRLVDVSPYIGDVD